MKHRVISPRLQQAQKRIDGRHNRSDRLAVRCDLASRRFVGAAGKGLCHCLLVALGATAQAHSLPDWQERVQALQGYAYSLSGDAPGELFALLQQGLEHRGGQLVEVLPLVATQGKPVAQQEAKQEAHCPEGEIVRGDECVDVRHGAYMVLLNLALSILGAFCSPIIGSRYDVDLGAAWTRWRARRADLKAPRRKAAAHG